jgi:hypothetical protein
MRGRRKNERYPLSVPLEGGFSFFQDLTIERYDETEVVALCDGPASHGQELTLDLMRSDSRVTVHVRVKDSTPAIVDGHVSYRLRLAIIGS